MASTSWEGTARRGAVSEAGFSCIMSIFASASQTAVSWCCTAPHTSSSKGAGGNESNVASAERAVIDLKRSLRAYYVSHGIMTQPQEKRVPSNCKTYLTDSCIG